MLHAVAMGFRVLMVYGCFSMPWKATTALTRQSAYAVPSQSTSFYQCILNKLSVCRGGEEVLQSCNTV
jgi:hypothetical protein